MKISTPKRFTKIGRIKNIQVIYVKSAPFPNGKAGALGKNPAQHSAKFLKKKKHQDCSWYSLYWHYLAFRVGQGLSVPWEQSGGLSQALFVGKRKSTKISLGAFCVGITYLPGQSPAKYCRRKRA